MVHQKTNKSKQQTRLYDKLHALRVNKPSKQSYQPTQTQPTASGILGIQSLLREIEIKLKRH